MISIDDVLKSHGIGHNITIKSYQSGSISPWSGNTITEKTISISAIDASKSIARISYRLGGGTNINDTETAIEIVDATTIKLTRNTGLNNYNTYYWEVIEFDNVKSKQTGIAITTGETQNVGMSPINMNRSILFCSGTNSSTGNTFYNCGFGYRITGISIFTLNSSVTTIKVYWQLLEFN